MRSVLIAAAFALVSSTAQAQTREYSLALDALGWGALLTPISIEVDGNLDTREWLVQSRQSGEYRVVAEQGASVCAGAWFHARRSWLSAVSVQRIGLVHKLVVDTLGVIDIIRLDMPACERK